MTIHPTTGHIFVGGHGGHFEEWRWNKNDTTATKMQVLKGHLDYITGLNFLGYPRLGFR